MRTTQKTRAEYGRELTATPAAEAYDGILLALAHDSCCAMGAPTLRGFGKAAGHVLYDLEHVLAPDASDLRL